MPYTKYEMEAWKILGEPTIVNTAKQRKIIQDLADRLARHSTQHFSSRRWKTPK